MKQNNKQRKLENLIIVLSPLNHEISKIPLAGKMYLKLYESVLKNKLPNYQNFIFK